MNGVVPLLEMVRRFDRFGQGVAGREIRITRVVLVTLQWRLCRINLGDRRLSFGRPGARTRGRCGEGCSLWKRPGRQRYAQRGGPRLVRLGAVEIDGEAGSTARADHFVAVV